MAEDIVRRLFDERRWAARVLGAVFLVSRDDFISIIHSAPCKRFGCKYWVFSSGGYGVSCCILDDAGRLTRKYNQNCTDYQPRDFEVAFPLVGVIKGDRITIVEPRSWKYLAVLYAR